MINSGIEDVRFTLEDGKHVNGKKVSFKIWKEDNHYLACLEGVPLLGVGASEFLAIEDLIELMKSYHEDLCNYGIDRLGPSLKRNFQFIKPLFGD